MVSFFRDLFLKDFWLKTFSLGLAFLIWITVSLAIQKEVTPIPNLPFKNGTRTFYNLPVTLLASAQDAHNFKVEPKEVEVTVEGDTKLLEGLKNADIRVMVVLPGTETPGDLVRPIQISAPAGVSHVRIEPPQVTVVPPKS